MGAAKNVGSTAKTTSGFQKIWLSATGALLAAKEAK
jgi:hypothetical protein